MKSIGRLCRHVELTEIVSYSGGLDTSTILAWLLEQDYEVV